MFRYFPVFIIGVFSLLIGLVGTAATIAFIYFPDASMEQRAAPLFGAAMVASLVVTSMNIAVMRGHSVARKGLIALFGISLAVAFPSLLMETSSALAAMAIGASVIGLWATCSRRYGEMLENLQNTQRIGQQEQRDPSGRTREA